MRFRPCIDIHNGKVKQIVGGSLTDVEDAAKENFVSELQASDYARMYKRDGLNGGHVILLNGADSPYYEATRQQALEALAAAPGCLQIGGGIRPDNAAAYLAAGASHVIVTSYVFYDGRLDWERLQAMRDAVGKEHLVLDLSCKFREDGYYVVTNRWQCFTSERVDRELFCRLSEYCDEFLVHGVDVEGKRGGIDTQLVQLLAEVTDCRITYAGGISSTADLEALFVLGKEKLDFTIGSALDLFGGVLSYREIATKYSETAGV